MSYYIQKGFTPEYLLSQSLEQRLFFVASMRKALDEQAELLKLLLQRR